MTLKSMTGHGMGEASAGGRKVAVEVSSVNRKQFDVRVSMPRHLSVLEPRIAERIHKEISRGSVNVQIEVSDSESVKAKGVRVDTVLASAYLKELRKMAGSLKLKDDLTARTIAGMPGVVEFLSGRESETLWPLISKALVVALKHFNGMRLTEGKALAGDFAARIKSLGKMVADIKMLAPAVAASYRQALTERLTEAGAEMEQGNPRLMQEVAMFADRCDISEEIVRLESHLKQASDMVASPQAVGRSMDFLCQEMFREINTIGSKANNVDISRHVITFKSELESFREQVQNVE